MDANGELVIAGATESKEEFSSLCANIDDVLTQADKFQLIFNFGKKSIEFYKRSNSTQVELILS